VRLQDIFALNQKATRKEWVDDAKYPEIELLWVESREGKFIYVWGEGDTEIYDGNYQSDDDWIILGNELLNSPYIRYGVQM